MKRVLLFCFLLLSNASFAQLFIGGVVIDRDSRQPVAYANIGVVNSAVGTISNPDGSFLIRIPEKMKKDTLLFSALGFGKRMIPIPFLSPEKSHTIVLSEQVVMLSDVTVSEKREKNKMVKAGNTAVRGGVMNADSLYAGTAMALRIDNDERFQQKQFDFPVYLTKASLRILRNNLASVKFRVRVNEVDSLTGQPGPDLLTQSIVVESTLRKGWLDFDLSPLNLQVSKPFFIVFEQILDAKDRDAIATGYREFIEKYPERLKVDTIEFEGEQVIRKVLKRGGIDLPGTFIAVSTTVAAKEKFTCYERETSFSEWKKIHSIITATVTLSNQRISKQESSKEPCEGDRLLCLARQQGEHFMDETGVNGMQICVSQGGKIKWSSAFGYADVQNKIPVTNTTRFRINSISKSMTSVALARLASESKLDWDLPIQQYVPSFPQKKYLLTTRHLAAHLGGIRDYKEDDLRDFIRTEHYNTSTEALTIFKDDSILFEPGTQFHYSTYGWSLAGAVIEGITGQSYLDYMRENVWHPMGMKETDGDDATKAIPNRSVFYDLTGEPNDLGDVSYKYPGGGLLSTAEDLVRFGNEVLHSPLLSEKQKEQLFQLQKTRDGKETGYGLGWYIGHDPNGHRIWYHPGDSFSSSSWLVIYPDKDLVIALLANSQQGVHFDIYELAALFYNNK